MRKHLFLLAAVLIAAAAVFITASSAKAEDKAEGIEKADRYFEDRLYSKAIEAYKPFLVAKKSNIKHKAEFKTVIAYYYQHKYDEALKKIFSFQTPSENVWKARYYLLKYALLKKTVYYDPVITDPEEVPLRLTESQKESLAKQTLRELWDMRGKLVNIPYYESKEYIIDDAYNRYTDLRMPENAQYPTLFDYTIPFWVENNIRPAEEIYEEGYKIKNKDRYAAAELWHLKRVNLINSSEEEFDNIKISWLLYIAGISADYNNSFDISKYIFRAKEAITKAKAAYEAAQLYDKNEMYEDAVKTLDYCMNLPLNPVTDYCKVFKKSITTPVLSFGNNKLTAAPDKDYKLKVHARNIEQFYIHLFKVDSAKIKQKNGRYSIHDYYDQIPQKPLHTLAVSVSYGKPYEPYENNIVLPKQQAGLYLLVLSTDKTYNAKSKNNNQVLLNFTDIALTATAYSKPKNLAADTNLGNYYNIYSLDAKTGLPKENVKIESNLSSKAVYTGKEGITDLKQTSKDNYLNALGSKNGNYAFIDNVWFTKYEQPKYAIAVNTDMAIYKAGSNLRAQITAAEFKGAQGYKLAEGKSVKITLQGPNYDTVNEKTVKLDSMGAASYLYQLPKDAMLGNYVLSAEINGSHEQVIISVEAFKTPEFKVILPENKEPVKFGVPFEVQGSALYYYGLNTSGAKVKYTVEKSDFYPVFWRINPNRGTKIIKTGETYTDKNGVFKITFTPTADDERYPVPQRYTVKVTVTDIAGNSINAQAKYLVSSKAVFFQTEKVNNFFRHDTQNLLTVKMQNINGAPLNGRATAKIYSASTPEKWEYSSYNMLSMLTKNKLVRTERLDFRDNQPALITVPPLKEGWYIVEYIPEGEEEADPKDSDVFIVVNVKDPSLNLPDNTAITEAKTYYPGEKAVVLIASPKAKSNKYVEVYKNQYLVNKTVLKNDGPSILELPVTENYRGGITLRWFSVFDYNYYSGYAEIDVPYPDYELNLTVSGNEVSFPGAKKTLNLSVTDKKGKPVDARAFMTVYDKAMDYYVPHAFETLNVYKNYYGDNPIESSLSEDMPVMVNAFDEEDSVMYDMGMSLKSVAAPKMMAARGAVAEAAEESSNEVQLRSDFTSNALWRSSIDVKQGKASVTFNLPQNIGQWAVLAAAFTKDIKTGKGDFAFITKKDMMLSLEAPRFLRGGDEIQLQALISNTTDKAMSAQVTLSANYDCDDLNDNCRTPEIPARTKTVTVPAQGQIPVTWSFKTPEEGSYIMFSATAKSATANDGEIKTVPILPAKQHITASSTIALKKGSNKIALTGIDKNAEFNAVHLTVFPSLLMPVLKAMPLLVKADNTMATYVADSYLPLAIFNKIYEDYPQIKQAAAQLPDRDTVAPAWNVNEELLLNNITQSPWYMLAKGYNQKQDIISLFDAQTVAKQKQKAEQTLAEFQNEDGGYAWIKGGKSSPFITLNVLESFAEAKRHGVKINEEAVKNALNYLLEEKAVNNTDIYRAYIYTSFPEEWNTQTYEEAKEIMRNFEVTPSQTPVNYAYAAMVYDKLGKSESANLQIERLFDLADTTLPTGTSWTMEDRSWQWFEDGLNLHATALKALNEINPDDDRIEGLVKWIIFNEKAEAWGNPQSAAKAVYALLEVMLKGNSADIIKVFTTEWNGKTSKIAAKPFDIDAKLTLSAYDDDITIDALKATINKAILSNEDNALDIDDFATLTALLTTDTPKESSRNGLVIVEKEYYLVKQGKASKLKDNDIVNVGDEVQVLLRIKAKSPFDFVIISDPKPAAFETDSLLSGWKYQQLYRYEELRDNVINFFIQDLPQGTYELKYSLRPTAAGQFTTGAAVMQSMFMPEVTAHSAGFKVRVK